MTQNAVRMGRTVKTTSTVFDASIRCSYRLWIHQSVAPALHLDRQPALAICYVTLCTFYKFFNDSQKLSQESSVSVCLPTKTWTVVSLIYFIICCDRAFHAWFRLRFHLTYCPTALHKLPVKNWISYWNLIGTDPFPTCHSNVSSIVIQFQGNWIPFTSAAAPDVSNLLAMGTYKRYPLSSVPLSP